jgi:uncharacterized protein YbaA (DUF1428 family)
MAYVDGFVILLPKKNLSMYKKMAKDGCKMWMKYGALDYKECVEDDLSPENVALTFSKLTKRKPDELVVFSYIVFKSRKHRDSVNKKVMAYYDKKYKDKKQEMPFTMKKFSYGGFKAFVEA